MNLTKHAQNRIIEHFSLPTNKLGLAIDATCGNGNDSLFLAQHAMHLIGFDVQELAIKTTKELLEHKLETASHDCHIELIHKGHENLYETLEAMEVRQAKQQQADVVMFNLGYLPKSDDLGITTTPQSTRGAVEQAIKVLSPNGMLTVLCYRGHHQGPEEFFAVNNVFSSLDKTQWKLEQYDSAKATSTTPVLLVLSRTKHIKNSSKRAIA